MKDLKFNQEEIEIIKLALLRAIEKTRADQEQEELQKFQSLYIKYFEK